VALVAFGHLHCLTPLNNAFASRICTADAGDLRILSYAPREQELGMTLFLLAGRVLLAKRDF
jgi:hypothetical protein